MGIYGWHDNELEAYNVVVENDLTVKGTISFGDEAADKLIIQGRVSSMTAAGAAIQISSAYTYGEGIEMRYQVTNWTGVGDSFKGMYLRSEAITTAATGKSVYGAEIYGVCNNVTMTTGSLWGTLTYAYVKGVDAVTVNNMYAVQGELTWDASRTGDCTITTAAACFRAKITGGRVADYTKIHGYELTIGEMDGDSAKFGKGLFMQDDSGMSGTCTLTTGIDIAIGCTTGISIGGTCSTAGLFLGTTNKVSFHDSGIYMRASADGHFEIVSDDTITLSVPGSGHGGIVFGGETDWGTGATGPDLDGTGWDWVTQTVGRVNTENITAAAYAGQYTALTVTKGQNLTSSFFANWNELYISASSVMTGASNFASIWAQVELGATVTSTDSGDFMAAVYGNFKTGATFTNNTKVCGFLAQSEVATSGLTNNGTISAFYAMKKSGCQVWDHGLYIADSAATTGISVGTCTTAITVGSVTGSALVVAGSLMGFDLTSTLGAGAAANANEINFTDNSTGSSGYARALWINATVAGDKTGSGEHNSLGIDQSVTGNTPYLYGLTYYSADVGDPTIGFAAPISVYQDDLGINLGAYVCIDLGVALSNAPTDRYHYMRFRDHSTAIPTSVFRFEGGHCASYLFDTTGGTGTPDFVTANAGQTPAADGVLIAINYHGTPYYIKAASAWS